MLHDAIAAAFATTMETITLTHSPQPVLAVRDIGMQRLHVLTAQRDPRPHVKEPRFRLYIVRMNVPGRGNPTEVFLYPDGGVEYSLRGPQDDNTYWVFVKSADYPHSINHPDVRGLTEDDENEQCEITPRKLALRHVEDYRFTNTPQGLLVTRTV